MALKSDQEERHNLIAQLKERQGDLARVMSEVGIADDKMPLDEGIKQPLPDLSSQTSQIKTPTMNAKDSIRGTMDMSLFVLKTYFGDMSDAELMQHPGPGCQHLAWQLGHLISSEAHLLSTVCPGAAAELPAGFIENHSKEAQDCDDAAKFCTKQQYIDLFDQTRAATLAALEALPDARLDEPAPEAFRSFCPTVGALFGLIGTHPMMHAGQFVPVRRALGKPVVI